MKVLYWNCTSPALGGNSFAMEKKNFIGHVVQTLEPDIVCLDEVSAGIDGKQAAKSYATNVLNGPGVSYARSNVVQNEGVHLNTVTWVKEGVLGIGDLQGGLPTAEWNTDRTKRDLTRVSCKIGGIPTSIWFLHANASPSGGQAAARLADTNADGQRSVYIGDFNCPIKEALGAVAPNVGGHRFTQWKRDDAFGTMMVPNRKPPVKYEPHDIIDYAICDSSQVKVEAEDSVGQFGNDGFLNFIIYFDHFPVVYQII